MPRLFVLLLCGLLQAAPVFGACSRPIVVPASPLGRMLTVDPATGEAAGIYPDLLREYGRRVGCEFVFPSLPRLRAELMAQNGQADLMVGMVRTAERDQWGDHVPLMGSEWVLIGTVGELPKTAADLVERSVGRFNAVRGFNYGPAFQTMLAALEKQGRLEQVNDTQSVIRKMLAGRAEFTMMPSVTFVGVLDEMGLREAWGRQIRFQRLAGLPPAVTGVYLSRRLPPADVAELQNLFQLMRRDGEPLARLRSVFTPEEMVSCQPLAPERKPR